jgi:uncharacterized membrane protein
MSEPSASAGARIPVALSHGPALSIWSARLALPLIVALGAALRFANLGQNSLWPDEGYSVNMAHRDLYDLVHWAAAFDSHPPLYYLLLRGWVSIFGYSEYAVRSLSAVIGVLLIPVMYRLGVTIVGRHVGLVAALLAAISPFYVQYSQEARMYILAGLLAGVSLLYFIRLLETRGRRDSVLFVLATALLLYTHVFGLFVLLAQVIVVLLSLRGSPRSSRRGELLAWARIFGALVVIYVPWLVAIAKQTSNELRGGENTLIGWINTPAPDRLLDTLIDYAGSRLALLCVALVALGAVWVGLRGPSRMTLARAVEAAFGGRHASVLAIWFGTPIVVPFLVSVTILPIYVPKYTIPASVAFYLLVAASIGRFGTRVAGAIALAAVAAVMLEATISYYRAYEPFPWGESIAYLDHNARSGDVVLFDKDYSRLNGFEYYWQRSDVVTKATVEELSPASDRVWVLLSLGPDDPDAVPRRLRDLGYVRTLDRHWDGDISPIDLLLFERPSA